VWKHKGTKAQSHRAHLFPRPTQRVAWLHGPRSASAAAERPLNNGCGRAPWRQKAWSHAIRHVNFWVLHTLRCTESQLLREQVAKDFASLWLPNTAKACRQKGMPQAQNLNRQNHFCCTFLTRIPDRPASPAQKLRIQTPLTSCHAGGLRGMGVLKRTAVLTVPVDGRPENLEAPSQKHMVTWPDTQNSGASV
jgi:hypothetical protein